MMNRENTFLTFFAQISFFSLLLLSDVAYAADVQTMLTNLSSIIYPIMSLALMFSFVSGVVMIFRALLIMKKLGQGAHGNHEMGGPLVLLLVGTVLIYLPTSTDIVLKTFFGDSTTSPFSGSTINLQALGTGQSLLQYGNSGSTLTAQFAALAGTLVIYIQFIGFLSFIRGWFLISKIGSQGAQPGNLGKGLTHIIGGIFAINFVNVIDLLSNTLGG